jgi:hypothetical protein
MRDGLQRDWFKTRVHFFCGFFIGAALGAYGFGEWRLILITAVVVGILAAFFLDDFWDGFLRGWW